MFWPTQGTHPSRAVSQTKRRVFRQNSVGMSSKTSRSRPTLSWLLHRVEYRVGLDAANAGVTMNAYAPIEIPRLLDAAGVASIFGRPAESDGVSKARLSIFPAMARKANIRIDCIAFRHTTCQRRCDFVAGLVAGKSE